MATYSINQGESLSLDYTLSPSQDLTGFTCRVQIRTSSGLDYEKYFTETANNNRTFVGEITSSESNNRLVGAYTLGVEIFNDSLGYNKEFCDTLNINEQCVLPDIEAIEALVAFAELQPTPESWDAANDAVQQLPTSTTKDDFEARLTALLPEIANVEAARALVVEAETYEWTALKQATAQDAVDLLVSTDEQAALGIRLDALDAKVSAEEATSLAQYTTLQADIDTAQPLINALAVEDQPALQARLNSIYVPARFEQADASEFTLVETPWIDQSGFSVRSPNYYVSQKLDRSLSSGDGWSSVHMKTNMVDPENTMATTFWGVGNAAVLGAAAFQNNIDDSAISAGTDIYFNGFLQVGSFTDVVISVDYSGASPHAYIIDVDTETVVFDTVLNTTTAIDIFTRCNNNSNLEREWFYDVNTGVDLTNNPFPIDSESILNTFGADTTGYIEGWTGSGNRPVKTQATTISIDSILPASPVLGDTITLTGSVTDGYGVDRSSDIVWYNKFINWYDDEAVQTGATSTFTPDTYGRYEIRAEYVDTNGVRVRAETVIDIVGTIAAVGNTTIDAANSHPNIANITGSTFRAGNSNIFKQGVISNNPMRGEFAYIELELRTLDIFSQFGFGITSILNCAPFSRDGTILWSGVDDGLKPQDGAGAGTYLEALNAGDFLGVPYINGTNAMTDLNQTSNQDRSNTAFYHGGVSGSETAYLGLAVDYRDTTKPPIVYAFHQDATTGNDKSLGNFTIRNCATSVVATIYVNSASNETVNPDCAINGGSDGAFAIDPRPLLTAAGIDLTGFIYGWTLAEAQA